MPPLLSCHFFKMIQSLQNMATIRSGYLFREKIEPHPSGQYRVIQIGDISANAIITSDSLTRFNLPDIKPPHIITQGDVLFISRGLRKKAVVVTEDLGRVVTTSQIFVIRPRDFVLPEYLAWYINQRPAQRYIEEHSTGTNISLINMESMGNLPIDRPSLESQSRIVRIHRLILREAELIKLIQQRRRTMVEMRLLKMIEP